LKEPWEGDMNMKIWRLTVGVMQENCYIAWSDNENKALVIDPGDEPEKIYDQLKKLELECSCILLTHGHFDHITGVEELKNLTGAPVWAGAKERELLEDSGLNVSARIRRPVTVKADRFLEDGEYADIAGLTFKTILTPGHTSGSVCFYFEDAGILFTGDTLFKSGVGRTDLPTGDEEALYDSITGKLLSLPGNTKCFPGHGEATDIVSESRFFGH